VPVVVYNLVGDATSRINQLPLKHPSGECYDAFLPRGSARHDHRWRSALLYPGQCDGALSELDSLWVFFTAREYLQNQFKIISTLGFDLPIKYSDSMTFRHFFIFLLLSPPKNDRSNFRFLKSNRH
jgi:hypothetical protein